MSIGAIEWVFSQDIRPSSVKFVLLALADNCGPDDGLVWPSIPTIAAKTSQDRKTVIEGISTLEGLGLLKDTGKRTGATKQVKVYKIIGLPTSDTHYTYRLSEESTGCFYFGVRSCWGEPESDPYMGSGMWPRSAKNLKKTILAVFETREEAQSDEIKRIRAAAENPLCMNVLGKQSRKRNSSENGSEEYRFSHERVPESGHGTVRETETFGESVNTPIAPKGAEGSSHGTKMTGFEDFWKEYPKKKSKGDAARAWTKRGCASILETIMLALSLQKDWTAWTKKNGQFIPYPASWLNAKGWEDEEAVEPAKPPTPTRKGF